MSGSTRLGLGLGLGLGSGLGSGLGLGFLTMAVTCERQYQPVKEMARPTTHEASR